MFGAMDQLEKCLFRVLIYRALKELSLFEHVPERLEMAPKQSKAEAFDFTKTDTYDEVQKITNNRGAVLLMPLVQKAHGLGSIDAVWDRAKAAAGFATDPPRVWRDIIKCVRPGGHVSVPGVYFGYADKIPVGSIVNKALTIISGQKHVQKYMDEVLSMVPEDKSDPSFIIQFHGLLSL